MKTRVCYFVAFTENSHLAFTSVEYLGVSSIDESYHIKLFCVTNVILANVFVVCVKKFKWIQKNVTYITVYMYSRYRDNINMFWFWKSFISNEKFFDLEKVEIIKKNNLISNAIFQKDHGTVVFNTIACSLLSIWMICTVKTVRKRLSIRNKRHAVTMP